MDCESSLVHFSQRDRGLEIRNLAAVSLRQDFELGIDEAAKAKREAVEVGGDWIASGRQYLCANFALAEQLVGATGF